MIVSNSTPLIELSKIRRLELLREIYGSLVIPKAVYTEVVIDGAGKPGAAEVKGAAWIHQHAVTHPSQVQSLYAHPSLDLGECEAIVLAEEIPADQVILDDRVAREVAVARGLPVIGTFGVLLVAKAEGIIPTVKPIRDALRVHGARISQPLYRLMLTAAREAGDA